MIRRHTVTIMHSSLVWTWKLKGDNCNKNKTHWRFRDEGVKKSTQIRKYTKIFDNSFTQRSNSQIFQNQYDQWEKKLDTLLYICFKKCQH